MTLALIIFGLTWALFLLYCFWGLRSVPKFSPVPGVTASGRPSASIMIAVKDDAREIGATVEALRNLTYPKLEIIVVVDRSTDATESIVRGIASQDPRIKVQVVSALPPAWLGKVHALHSGVSRATGDFIIFMDADMAVRDEDLELALHRAQDLQLDHLSIVPRVASKGFLHDVMMCTSTILFISSSRPWMSIARRPLKSVKGMGKFNMVRRSFFSQTEGFEWLKMDVADDVALAQLIAKNGGRSLLFKSDVNGPALSWYDSFWGVVKGLEKNIVSGFTNYDPLQIILMPLVSASPVLVPLVGLLGDGPSQAAALGCLGLSVSFAVLTRRFLFYPLHVIAAFPLGLLLLGLILLRASVVCFRTGGIRWSGTTYPIEDLRKGTRVKMGL